jgi:CRP/FNR family cyclic AMP-dependent transcriptional regulator
MAFDGLIGLTNCRSLAVSGKPTMTDQRLRPVNSRELFNRVADTQMITMDYQNKETIFTQGDKADAMFYIQKGNVKLTVASSRGKKAVISVLRPGDCFGEGCLATQALRTSTAMAIQPSTIARMKRATIVSSIHEDPSFAKIFISHLLGRIDRIEEEFVDQIFSSSEKRLARILLMLAGFGLDSKSDPAILNVSQETLAEMVGTTRSRISHFMNRFRRMGLIDYGDSLQVHKELLTFLLHV